MYWGGDFSSVEEVQLMAEWTDERMDDLAAQMAAGFDRTDREVGDLRREIGAFRIDVKRDIDGLRTEFKGDIYGLRTELKGDMRMLHADIEGVRAMMFRFCITVLLLMGGFMAALIGLLATSPA